MESKDIERTMFQFEDSPVKTFSLNGEPIFDPYDVSNVLEMNEHTTRRKLTEMNKEGIDYVIEVPNMLLVEGEGADGFNPAKRLFLTELGVMTFIWDSKTTKAKTFQKWVLDVVKQIRDKGYYAIKDIKKMVKTTEDMPLAITMFTGLTSPEIRSLQEASPRMRLRIIIDLYCKRAGKNLAQAYNYAFEAIYDKYGLDITEKANKRGLSRMEYLETDPGLLEFFVKFVANLYAIKSYEMKLLSEGITRLELK